MRRQHFADIQKSKPFTCFSTKSQFPAYKAFPLWPTPQIQDALNQQQIFLMAAMIIAVLIAVMTVFSIKYLMTATSSYGLPERCASSQMQFDGWSFTINCIECFTGYPFNGFGVCTE